MTSSSSAGTGLDLVLQKLAAMGAKLDDSLARTIHVEESQERLKMDVVTLSERLVEMEARDVEVQSKTMTFVRSEIEWLIKQAAQCELELAAKLAAETDQKITSALREAQAAKTYAGAASSAKRARVEEEAQSAHASGQGQQGQPEVDQCRVWFNGFPENMVSSAVRPWPWARPSAAYCGRRCMPSVISRRSIA